MRPALVSFVALGPGDAALRSELASRRLTEADAVVEASLEPERLIALARAGKRVVCSVEGEVTESVGAMALARAVSLEGVAIEIVPGVGANASAAAFAGVVGRALRVRSGDELVRAVEGLERSLPVTLIAHAGSASQRVVVTTAGQAASPSWMLGEKDLIVAWGAPDEALRWYERRPLFGKRVLVMRAREQAAGTAAQLREEGAEPVVVPTIEIGPPSDPAPLARAIEELAAGAYDWVAFTSANGVLRTWEALAASGRDARAFGRARLAVIGPATASALEKCGLRADLVAKEFRGEGLAEEMVRVLAGAGRSRVLLARAARARGVLPMALREAGCEVDVVTAYETHPPAPATVEPLLRDLETRRIDAVAFTSSSTVDHLCDLLGARAASLLEPARIACIGPVTADTARARGLRVDVVAVEYTVSGLVRALAETSLVASPI